MSKSKYLILVSIGSVQRFIEQSQKVKQLYASSQMIIDMITTAENCIETKYNRDENNNKINEAGVVILPNQDNKSSKPNFFIAEVEVESENEFKGLHSNIKEKIKSELLKNSNGIKNSEELLKSQLEDIINLQVVVVKYDKNVPENYAKTYFKLYEQFNALKHINTFEYEPERGEKCSVCHIRNAYEISDEKKKNEGNKEKLCPVCELKTKYIIKDNSTTKITKGDIYMSKSTAELASLHLLNKNEILYEDYKKIFYEYKEDLLFKDTFDILMKEKLSEKDCKKLFNSNKTELENDYEPLHKNNSIKYYALIKADIDNLGKWMSGKYVKKDVKNQGFDLKEYQQIVSGNLSEFVRKVAGKLDNEYVQPVYIGGDDILFFRNPKGLFTEENEINNIDQLDQLMEETFERIKEQLQEKFKENIIEDNKEMTLSKSIVVAHYKTPLQNVLNISRTTLDEAKARYKDDISSSKQGVAITYITGSRTVKTSYIHKNDYRDVKKLQNEFKKELSKGIIFQIEKALKPLKINNCKSYDQYIMNKNISDTLIKKVLNNKKYEDENSNQIILNIFSQQCSGEIESIDEENFYNVLHVARLIGEQLKILDSKSDNIDYQKGEVE